MSSQFDVVIIGGGVLGLTTAFHLASRRISTLVVERESSFGMHASGKNAGMIRQLYRHPKLTEWAKRSIAEWPVQVRNKAFRETGSFVAGRDVPDHHSEIFQQKESLISGAGTGDPVRGVYAAADGLLDPHTYISEIYSLIDQRFCRVAFSAPVKNLSVDASGWTVVTARGDRYQGKKVVNAAGAWVNDILASGHAARMQPVLPYSRHLFMIHGWEDGFMPVPQVGFYWDESGNWYMRQWDARTRLVSVCDEISSSPEHYTPDPSIGREIAAKLLEALPGIADSLSLGRSWHCFRSYTPDRLPIVGPDPKLPNFFWLAAFGGFGMSTSYAASADAAAYIAGEKVELEPDFLPRASNTNGA